MGQEQINLTVVDHPGGDQPIRQGGIGIDAMDRRIAHAKIPGYRLVGKCGAGGMGRVYKANQISLRREVAIKILDPALVSASGFGEMFSSEINILANFRHPNVVTIIDAGQAGGLPYFVMEYITGVTLRRLMAESDLTPSQIITICGKICEGLAATHRIGVVHRDLKPENVMLSRHGVVKIMDFGIAAIRDRTKSSSGKNFLGTRLYAAKEQLDGVDVDGRADIYSLGVMLYEMLTLRLPGIDGPPPSNINPDCPKWLDGIVAKAMAKLPGERYGSATELVTALRRGQNAATRATIEKQVATKVMQYGDLIDAAMPLGRLSCFISKLFGLTAFTAFATSLFLPYISATASNLQWDRSLQDSGLTKVPVIPVVVALACLSLTTSCLKGRAVRGLAQIMLAWVASAAAASLWQQMNNKSGWDWQAIAAQMGRGSHCYFIGTAALLLGGFISIPGIRKMAGLLLYVILMVIFYFGSKMLPA